MFKLDLFLLIDDNWENIDYSIEDRVPEKGDKFYHKGKEYIVVDINSDDDMYFDAYIKLNK